MTGGDVSKRACVYIIVCSYSLHLKGTLVAKFGEDKRAVLSVSATVIGRKILVFYVDFRDTAV